MVTKRLKQNQRMRIIISGVAIYTTVRQLRGGMFGSISQNAASQKALAALEHSRSDPGIAGQCCTGICGTWENLPVQLDVL